jgi:hypothetical protein
MESKFHIKCRTEPVREEGPLVLRIEDDISIISATIAPQRGSPRGLNIDALVIFDMQPDGGVDGIEILCVFGIDLSSRREAPRTQEKYWRLFLDPSMEDVSEPDVEVVMHRLDNFFIVRFKTGDVDSKYLLGPALRLSSAQMNCLG